jgi:hypothetical protein
MLCKIVKLFTILCIGTSKVAEPYKIGERTTDVMLEILNLDKKDVISIGEISNQEFSEVIKHTALCIHLSFLVSVLSLSTPRVCRK